MDHTRYLEPCSPREIPPDYLGTDLLGGFPLTILSVLKILIRYPVVFVLYDEGLTTLVDVILIA